MANVKHSLDVAASVDQLFELRERYRALDKEVQRLKREYAAQEAHVMLLLHKLGVEQGVGDKALVALHVSMVPDVIDWGKLNAYIVRTGEVDLLQRRVSVSAVRERWQEGEEVPGVEHLRKVSLNLNELEDAVRRR